MIEYKISFNNPLTHIIDVEVLFPTVEEEYILINLPAWRPGRYELANYAKNIIKLQAFTFDESPIVSYKISKDVWKIETKRKKAIKLNYSYYAFAMDAGNSWLDDEQLYINPINCLVYDKERINQKCVLSLDVPASYEIATGLKAIDKTKFIAKDYFELADCPIIASPSLKRFEYSINEVEFNIWIQGEINLNMETLLSDFRRFSKLQMDMMQGFPEKDYHFLFQILPYKFRHGVEHRNSTVITVGPGNQINDQLYNDLLGISSHELFHTWNVLKIRPKELMPYDFSKENYFKTGYIAEGITTYYGDLLLVRSKVFSIEQYFKELTDLLQKHFDNIGNRNMSLADSSFDLWLDGYVPGVPGRKVSIYVKGAIVAFLVDIEIRRRTKNASSLDDIIRYLWENFGKCEKGYEEKDLEKAIKNVAGLEIKGLLNKCVRECSDLKKEIEETLSYLGLELKSKPYPSLDSLFGIKCNFINGKFVVDQIHPDSPAIFSLSRNDEIVSVDNLKYEGVYSKNEEEITLSFYRGNRLRTEKIRRKKNKHFFFSYEISLKETLFEDESKNLNLWLDLE
ncbi:MAG TPA: M61 family peptidase [Cytophagales bacterium]|nr:M61 family peptidase [Cytophagales bacterium]